MLGVMKTVYCETLLARLGAAVAFLFLGLGATFVSAKADDTGLAKALDTPTNTPVLLELFTSQGCSSCPPADALFDELRNKPGVITLSFAVDYWNYLGWHDTLSSPENSDRQRDYALSRGDGKVYTPQVVVDGIKHVNGANEAAIEMAIRTAERRLRDVKVTMSMRAEDDSLLVDIGGAPTTSDMRQATVWLAVAKDEETVKIKRGENRGETITYTHPVRELMPVGMWKGEPTTLRLPLKDLHAIGGDCLVSMLQVEGAGPILGAAMFRPEQELRTSSP
jgi:hypothetical protein